MNTRRAIQFHLGLIAVTFMAAAVAWFWLPKIVPIHWNWVGQPDGWAGKWVALLLPVVTVTVTGLIFLVLPHWRSEKYSVWSFIEAYWKITLIIQGMIVAIFALTVVAMGLPRFELLKPLFAVMMLGIGLMGRLMDQVRPNPWVGVRTKWTMQSDQVWQSTHQLAAKLMFWSGMLGAIAVVAGVPWYLPFSVLMIACLYPIWFSYREARRLGLK